MPAMIVAVDRIAGLDERSDHVEVPAAVLTHAVHERDDTARLGLGQPRLVVELHVADSREMTLNVLHASSFTLGPSPTCR